MNCHQGNLLARNSWLVNWESEGNKQKKQRTEDLDLSTVIQTASETAAPGHEGGIDSKLSDEDKDLTGPELTKNVPQGPSRTTVNLPGIMITVTSAWKHTFSV